MPSIYKPNDLRSDPNDSIVTARRITNLAMTEARNITQEAEMLNAQMGNPSQIRFTIPKESEIKTIDLSPEIQVYSTKVDDIVFDLDTLTINIQEFFKKEGLDQTLENIRQQLEFEKEKLRNLNELFNDIANSSETKTPLIIRELAKIKKSIQDKEVDIKKIEYNLDNANGIQALEKTEVKSVNSQLNKINKGLTEITNYFKSKLLKKYNSNEISDEEVFEIKKLTTELIEHYNYILGPENTITIDFENGIVTSLIELIQDIEQKYYETKNQTFTFKTFRKIYDSMNKSIQKLSQYVFSHSSGFQVPQIKGAGRHFIQNPNHSSSYYRNSTHKHLL
jgi:hypothetical protein